MLWQESGGPDDYPFQWERRPMQIGRFARDKGFKAVRTGAENTRLFVPQELRDKLNHQPMNSELNIRAGIAYLYNRARPRMKTQVDDNKNLREEKITSADGNATKFARRVGTTVEQVKIDNGLTDEDLKHLKANTPLKFHNAHEVPDWVDWNKAMEAYNSQTTDPNNAPKVRANYERIKRGWAR
jgi:hypothetical protein